MRSTIFLRLLGLFLLSLAIAIPGCQAAFAAPATWEPPVAPWR